MERIGFIFTEKELLYLENGIKLDLEMLYISHSLGENTDTIHQKEGSEDGKYL